MFWKIYFIVAIIHWFIYATTWARKYKKERVDDVAVMSAILACVFPIVDLVWLAFSYVKWVRSWK